MKFSIYINRKRYEQEYQSLPKGKYSKTPVNELDTQYLSYALETFNLEEGMRYVLANELNKRLNLKDYI